MPWFSAALAGLGPRFHPHAVRVALFVPQAAARTAGVLHAMNEGGVAASVVLDELRPVVIGGGRYGDVVANQVCVGQCRAKDRLKYTFMCAAPSQSN